jgi:hypothetical protein
LLLPYTANPKETWHGIRLSSYAALFMHATVTGAVVENGVVMENSKFPILPRSCKVYSGDVHVPQTVANITYVGAPYPIKFGDKYPCRMLLLDEHYNIKLQIPLQSLRKIMLDISSVGLRHLQIRHGDQVKIRFSAPPTRSRNGRRGRARSAMGDRARRRDCGHRDPRRGPAHRACRRSGAAARTDPAQFAAVEGAGGIAGGRHTLLGEVR